MPFAAEPALSGRDSPTSACHQRLTHFPFDNDADILRFPTQGRALDLCYSF